MDLKAVRNVNYELTGITPVSQKGYDKHTESIKKAQGATQENGSVNNTIGSISIAKAGETGNTINSGTYAFSEGDPNQLDSSFIFLLKSI